MNYLEQRWRVLCIFQIICGYDFVKKKWYTHGWDGEKIGKDDQEDDEGVVVPEVANSLYVSNVWYII